MPLDIPTDFHIDLADFSREQADLRAVREPVFQLEQQVPPELEWDDDDARAIHLLARDRLDQPIGTVRLTRDGRIGRMAVLSEWRGRGVGKTLLGRIVDVAREQGHAEVVLHAQLHALPFYSAAGFVAEGEIFLDAGIEHRSMRRALDQLTAPPRTPPASVDDAQALETPGACREATQGLLDQARHQISLLTQDLTPELFCTPDALEAFRRVAVSGKQATIRILIRDPAAALRHAGPLIALAQRLSSSITLRTPLDESDLRNPETCLLNDAGGYLHLPTSERLSGATQQHGPARHRQLLEDFNRAWEQAESPVELRQFKL